MGVWPVTKRRTWRIALPLIVGLAIVGCGRPAATTMPAPDVPRSPAPTTAAASSPSATASSAAPMHPTPLATVEPLPGDLPGDIAYAVRQRRNFGLRSDLAWVRQVAADPQARMDVLDVLMLPEEETAFLASQSSYRYAAGAIQRYAGGHEDEFGGLYIDQPGHVVVSLWTIDPDGHLAAVRKLGGGLGPIVARQVRWSEKELRAVQQKIDLDWLRKVDAEGEGVGADIVRNIVQIEISSANPEAPRLIVDHYARKLGIPPEMLDVVSDGTGVKLMPTGIVDGIVVTAAGRRPGPNDLIVDTEPERAGICEGWGTSSGVANNGSFKLVCTRGDWTVRLKAPGPNASDDNVYNLPPDELVTVGHATFTVRADRTIDIRISLDEGADIRG